MGEEQSSRLIAGAGSLATALVQLVRESKSLRADSPLRLTARGCRLQARGMRRFSCISIEVRLTTACYCVTRGKDGELDFNSFINCQCALVFGDTGVIRPRIRGRLITDGAWDTLRGGSECSLHGKIDGASELVIGVRAVINYGSYFTDGTATEVGGISIATAMVYPLGRGSLAGDSSPYDAADLRRFLPKRGLDACRSVLGGSTPKHAVGGRLSTVPAPALITVRGGDLCYCSR